MGSKVFHYGILSFRDSNNKEEMCLIKIAM